MKKLIFVALLVPFLGACSSIQKVDPVTSHSGEKVCIVENSDVREGFLASYRRAVEAKGLEVQVVPAASSTRVCPLTSTYTANWNWDLAMYMRYAQISIFRDGQPAGQAMYDAHTAGMSKFINADEKIQELVNQLFVTADQR